MISSTTATGGSWAALDPETGKILWQTADPGLVTLTTGALTGHVRLVGARAGHVGERHPLRLVDGVQAATADQMYALDAKTGEILWRFAAGTSVNAGPAVVDGSVYWGSGYTRAAEGGPNPSPKFYAFSIEGR